MARRRFQKGSVFLNKTKTQWLGMFAEYVLDSHGVERRNRKQVVLCPVRIGETVTRKREAQKLLQPYLDRVNSSLSAPARERKNATFEAFAAIWECDYLSLCKPATQVGTKSHLKRLKAAFEQKDMRQIDAGHIQHLISAMDSEGLAPKTIRNMWGVVNLIWSAALAQKYVDAMLPKPKLPRKPKKRPRFFTLEEVSKIIAASQDDHLVFYWLAAETGLRAGELAGLKLTDIDGDRLTVSQSVWHGKEQAPKTDNAMRTVALSPQLIALLWEQIARQKVKGHEFLFSASTGSPWDMDVYRNRKMRKLLTALGISQAGFHAFRHFNVSLLDALRVPLKTIQERIGHAFTGSFTLDVYGGQPQWNENLDAARKAGKALAEAVEKAKADAESATSGSLSDGRLENFVSLTAIQEQTASESNSEAVETT